MSQCIFPLRGRVKYVLYDCDNTMGLSGKDIDDGLALLYLLGSPHIQLIGVTTTFGNASLSEVHDSTRRMFTNLGIEKIPLMRGAESTKNRRSEAAEYLVKTLKECTVPVTVLATGACTNLYGAYLIDNDFFLSAEEIVLMGGMTQQLYINKKKLDELNFSTDPEASYRVLSSGGQVNVITANICTQAMLEESRLKKIVGKNPQPVFRYIENPALDWCRVFNEEFGVGGFYAWDIVAAVYISHPTLFRSRNMPLLSNSKTLSTGMLTSAPAHHAEKLSDPYIVNVPTKIRNMSKFWRLIISAWKRLDFS